MDDLLHRTITFQVMEREKQGFCNESRGPGPPQRALALCSRPTSIQAPLLYEQGPASLQS